MWNCGTLLGMKLLFISVYFLITAEDKKISKSAKTLNRSLDDLAKILKSNPNAYDGSYGYPNLTLAKELQSALNDALAQGWSDYTAPYIHGDVDGDVGLRNAIAKIYGKLTGLAIDPMNEVVITIGATEALSATIMSLVNPGDQVIIIEPGFYLYSSMVENAGGHPVHVSLKSPHATSDNTIGNPSSSSQDWTLDMNELKQYFNKRTKLLVLNSPNNPTGKVFSREELLEIAELCKRYNVFILSDEVYSFDVYPDDSVNHTSIASLPGMYGRTVTVGSAGKTWLAAGWRIGWAYGPQKLIQVIKKMSKVTFHPASKLLQVVLSTAFEGQLDKLGSGTSFWERLRKEAISKRDRVVKALNDSSLSFVIPKGALYIVINVQPFEEVARSSKVYQNPTSDYPLVEWLSRELNFHAYPMSLFYFSNKGKYAAKNCIRVTFLNNNETVERLLKKINDLERVLRERKI